MAERTVRFFEITDEHGHRLPYDLPFADMLDAVDKLPDEDAYVDVGSSMEVLGSTYRPTTGARAAVPLLALDRITRDVRLRIERQRNYRPLQLLQDETLAEPTFFSIFPRNVLAVMRNSGSAPGVVSFRDYINQLQILDGDIGISPLVDRNAARALADVGTLTRLTVAFGADAEPEDFGDSPMIAEVLRDARQRLGAVAFEFTVKIATKGQHEASEAAVNEVQGLATSPAPSSAPRRRRSPTGDSRTGARPPTTSSTRRSRRRPTSSWSRRSASPPSGPPQRPSPRSTTRTSTTTSSPRSSCRTDSAPA
jgi:hypothetical protein